MRLSAAVLATLIPAFVTSAALKPRQTADASVLSFSSKNKSNSSVSELIMDDSNSRLELPLIPEVPCL